MGNLRVLELYSGIGGMHYALKESGIPYQIVAAIDINTTANLIYKHNFPDTPLWNKTIEGISLDDFNKLSFDMILMSPPCQPFTRIGLQGDISDPRAKSLLYILDLLPRLCKLPCFILLENVKGFETSSARERLVKTLMECGYDFQEVMVSPTSVGIPNSRLRYFLIAKISTEQLSPQTSLKILDAFPHPAKSDSAGQLKISSPICECTSQPEVEMQRGSVLYKRETQMDAHRKINQNSDLSVREIQDFLEPQMEINMEHYLLPPKTLLRYGLLLDIVQPTCRRSVCFTKGYGRYVEGTGSVLQCSVGTEVSLDLGLHVSDLQLLASTTSKMLIVLFVLFVCSPSSILLSHPSHPHSHPNQCRQMAAFPWPGSVKGFFTLPFKAFLFYYGLRLGNALFCCNQFNSIKFIYIVLNHNMSFQDTCMAESVFMGLDQYSEEEKLQWLLKLKLRYFTPREVANLMGFPQSFCFPEQVPTIQQYRVLGNSLNVLVVAKLLQLLVS